jgi:hypothetical protein
MDIVDASVVVHWCDGMSVMVVIGSLGDTGEQRLSMTMYGLNVRNATDMEEEKPTTGIPVPWR